VRGHLREARGFLDEALRAEAAQAPTPLRAFALGRAGAVAAALGDLAGARDRHEQSLALSRALEDQDNVSGALLDLGGVAMMQGDLTWAHSYLEEGLALCRDTGNRNVLAVLNTLALVTMDQGDYGGARSYQEESLALCRAQGDTHVPAAVLHNLGVVLVLQGDPDAARALFEEALAMNRQTGHRQWEAQNLLSLGQLAREGGDHPAARSLLTEVLTIQRDIEAIADLPDGLEAMAWLAQAEGQPDRAARLLGAAQALRVRLGAPVLPADMPGHEGRIDQVRHGLGEPRFTAAWGAGQAMTWEQAVADALLEETSG
jgi:tetratricopeptide (TPR) repeat protein